MLGVGAVFTAIVGLLILRACTAPAPKAEPPPEAVASVASASSAPAMKPVAKAAVPQPGAKAGDAGAASVRAADAGAASKPDAGNALRPDAGGHDAGH